MIKKIMAKNVMAGDKILARDKKFYPVRKVEDWSQWGVWIHVEDNSHGDTRKMKSSLVRGDVQLTVDRI